MGDIIKAAATALVCSAAVVIISRYIPEYAPFAQIAAVVAVFLSVSDAVGNIIVYFTDFLSEGVIDPGYAMLVFKALGIAVIAQFGADFCRDCGNSALAFALETTAKAAILSMSIPMLKNLADVTAGLLKG